MTTLRQRVGTLSQKFSEQADFLLRKREQISLALISAVPFIFCSIIQNSKKIHSIGWEQIYDDDTDTFFVGEPHFGLLHVPFEAFLRPDFTLGNGFLLPYWSISSAQASNAEVHVRAFDESGASKNLPYKILPDSETLREMEGLIARHSQLSYGELPPGIPSELHSSNKSTFVADLRGAFGDSKLVVCSKEGFVSTPLF